MAIGIIESIKARSARGALEKQAQSRGVSFQRVLDLSAAMPFQGMQRVEAQRALIPFARKSVPPAVEAEFKRLSRRLTKPEDVSVLAKALHGAHNGAVAEGHDFASLVEEAEKRAGTESAGFTSRFRESLPAALNAFRAAKKVAAFPGTRAPSTKSKAVKEQRKWALTREAQKYEGLREHLMGTLGINRRDVQTRAQSDFLSLLAESGVRNGVRMDLNRFRDERYRARLEELRNLDGQFVMVHATDYVPKDGVVRPTGEFEPGIARDSIHFSLNSLVGSHAYGNWASKGVVILVPFQGASSWVHNFNPVDTFGFGKLVLPEGSTVLVAKEKAEQEKLRDGQKLGKAVVRIVDAEKENSELNASGFAIKAGQQTVGQLGRASLGGVDSALHYAVVKELLRKGVLPMTAGMWSWNGWFDIGGLRQYAEQRGFKTGGHYDSLPHVLQNFSLLLRQANGKGTFAEEREHHQSNLEYFRKEISGLPEGALRERRYKQSLLRTLAQLEQHYFKKV